MRLWNHQMLFKTSTRWIHRHSSFDKQFYDHIGKIYKSANERTVIYVSAIAVGILGLSYAAVPLYRLYCQASGYGGTVSKAEAGVKIEQMSAVRDRELLVKFSSSTSAGMQWQFKPHQKEIRIVPGETALAFYSAKNPTDRPITGIATYNVIPFDAGQYFNKIQV
jgi:cytochrome c oxidase assembly protein subunit 11